MAIARFPVVVMDCPDPKALAEFYGTLLGWEVQPGGSDSGDGADSADGDNADGDSGDGDNADGDSGEDDGSWWSIRADYGDSMAFQAVAGYRAPAWPGQEHPQQMHVDVVVDDLDVAEAAVLDLGATKHAHQPGTTFRVFLDPAGHPFCLCLS
jgi:predicted enzyme related to lactoylglutathione lyase